MPGAIPTFEALKNGGCVGVSDAWHAENSQKEYHKGVTKSEKGAEACDRKMRQLSRMEDSGVELVRFVGGRYVKA